MRKEEITPINVARFWLKVKKTPTCWVWQGNNYNGYGHVTWGTYRFAAHRLAYEIIYGAIPDDLQVNHRCNNSLCVNPAHLYVGSQQENIADKVAASHQVRGERVNTAKLTASQVQEIRKRYQAGGISHSQLAHEYGVKKPTIGQIIRRDHWKHIE